MCFSNRGADPHDSLPAPTAGMAGVAGPVAMAPVSMDRSLQAPPLYRRRRPNRFGAADEDRQRHVGSATVAEHPRRVRTFHELLLEWRKRRPPVRGRVRRHCGERESDIVDRTGLHRAWAPTCEPTLYPGPLSSSFDSMVLAPVKCSTERSRLTDVVLPTAKMPHESHRTHHLCRPSRMLLHLTRHRGCTLHRTHRGGCKRPRRLLHLSRRRGEVARQRRRRRHRLFSV